ncbi:hypothetical protein I7I50_01200 [Histoplasma capsulatum G186AR]|nr:hypothetical protein I7I52_08973 [Histoplasma capsulatum]QSS73146.1 hypothetical protein I7I50_01200 [Histoplasma capsulatum G186AR]
MGQKHNRRRTRPRSRYRSNALPKPDVLPAAAPGCQLPCDSCRLRPPLFSPFPYLMPDPEPPATAQKWQNQQIVCQNGKGRQIQEATKLEAEYFRLFGGEPGDDITLCYRMLEYFGGLDYIDW